MQINKSKCPLLFDPFFCCWMAIRNANHSNLLKMLRSILLFSHININSVDFKAYVKCTLCWNGRIAEKKKRILICCKVSKLNFWPLLKNAWNVQLSIVKQTLLFAIFSFQLHSVCLKMIQFEWNRKKKTTTAIRTIIDWITNFHRNMNK